MRVLGIVFLSLALFGCSVSTKTEYTRKDLEIFQKTFTGTLVGKQIEEIDKEEPVLIFWKKYVQHIYFRITVTDSAGNSRKFFDYTNDKKRINQLRQYNRDLQKGDTIVVGLGLVDDKNDEEQFDLIRKVI